MRILAKATVGLVVIGAAVLGGAYLLSAEYEDRLKTEVTGLINQLELTEAERARVRGMLDTVHEDAYEKALNFTGKPRFNIEKFLDELFAGLAAKARAQGDEALAEKIEKERQFVSLEKQP